MKKNVIMLLFSLVISTFCFSQNKMTNEQYQRMTKNEKELYNEVKKADSLREIRISNYLISNKSTSRNFNYNGKQFSLYDIIDENPIFKSVDNLSAARATGTVNLQIGGNLNLNLDGTGITVGVWDEGPVQDTHTEFLNSTQTNSRITNIETLNTNGNSGFNFHATHVSGTIAARGANNSARGMATNVNIKSYNFNNDSVEMITEVSSLADPIFLSNHSYGIPINQGGTTLDSWFMGAYTSGAREIDDIARTYPNYLIVASAGNSGNTTYNGGLYFGYDKLTGDKNAKNNLVIANADPSLNPFTNELSSFTINSSSSQGPTDDLRIKPDIAGDGTNLLSTAPNNTYAQSTGTSMSAPNVTGSLVLLQQYFNQLSGNYMKASTLKALVCHTARDDNSVIGPDPLFGWGLLDATKAANLITANNDGNALIQELTLNNGSSYSYSFQVDDSSESLIATICWTDVPGTAVNGASSINDQTPRLVNDLDIRLTKEGIDYFPWRLDYSSSTGFSNSKGDNIRDNVERIDIEVPSTGTYTLTVSHKGSLQSAQPFGSQNQDFSLILSGAQLTLSTEEVNNNDFAVWPNPATDKINFKFNKPAKTEIAMFDLLGRSVYNSTVDIQSSLNDGQIDTSHLESGVYLLKFTQGNNEITKKIIIE